MFVLDQPFQPHLGQTYSEMSSCSEFILGSVGVDWKLGSEVEQTGVRNQNDCVNVLKR